jgi:hypothetical protein
MDCQASKRSSILDIVDPFSLCCHPCCKSCCQIRAYYYFSWKGFNIICADVPLKIKENQFSVVCAPSISKYRTHFDSAVFMKRVSRLVVFESTFRSASCSGCLKVRMSVPGTPYINSKSKTRSRTCITYVVASDHTSL